MKSIMPARLDSIIYNEWLKESPKKIEGGSLELTLCDGYGEMDDAWNLDAHEISSDILDSYNAGDLYIMGVHDKFEGFKIYVNIKRKFLLMGHQHHSAPFIKDGTNLGDHPHFHEIRYYRRRYNGGREPGKTHELSPLLFTGMDSEQFLKVFLKNYYFDHVGEGEVLKLTGKQFQTQLAKFDKQNKGTQ